jgi:hypothetical protein
MRDINRIDRILALIRALWIRYPDLRLGQLLQNFAGFDSGDNYYKEDSDTEVVLLASNNNSLIKEIQHD